MAIKSYKMGPGTFKLGTAGVRDASCQVTNLRVEASESVSSSDVIDVLCGEQLAAEDEVTLTWKLSGSVVQDIDATDLVAYTWANPSAVVDFEFIPSTDAGRAVTGDVRIIPLTIGGDVKTRNEADIAWAIVGTPVLGDV